MAGWAGRTRQLVLGAVIATSAGSAAARAGLATIVLLMLFTMKISKVLAEKTRKCWDLRAGGGKDW